MSTRAKNQVMKSLEEILAETATDSTDENDEATRMMSNRSDDNSGDDQSSPLDDAFDAHTVIRPLSSFPPPPKPAEAPKSAAPVEEKPQPRPAPPVQPRQPASRRVEPSTPIDIARPADTFHKPVEPKHVETKPAEVKAEPQAAPKNDDDFKVKMIHPKKVIVQEPSPITALIERPVQSVAKNPYDEVTANTRLPEDLSMDDLTYESSATSPGTASSGAFVDGVVSSEVTGVSLVNRSRNARQFISRVPLRLFLPFVVFAAIVGAWAMLRHAPVAETSNQFDAAAHGESQSMPPARQSQSMGSARNVAERQRPTVQEVQPQVEQPVVQQGAQPSVTPPPTQQVSPPESLLSSFDRAFTKTQDQAKYSTNRL